MAYVKLVAKDGEVIHETQDCPDNPHHVLAALLPDWPPVLAITYGGKLYGATGERDGDFHVFKEGNSIWDAGGPLD